MSDTESGTEVLDAVETQEIEQVATEPAPTGEPDGEISREELYIRDLRTIRNRLKDAQSKEADLKEKHKAAKGRVEAIAEELAERIDEFDRELNDPQLKLPFGAKKEIDPEAARIAEMRKTLLSSAQFGFTEKVIQSLTERGVVTFGDFCDFEKRYQNGADWLLDLPGIGQTKADNIRDKVQDFQLNFRLPEPAPEAEVEPADPDPATDYPQDDDTIDIAG